MGYDYHSFEQIFEGLPHFKTGTSGNDVFKHFVETERNRLDIEAFIGLKLESTLTKICLRQEKYIQLYRAYKEIAEIAQIEYEKSFKF